MGCGSSRQKPAAGGGGFPAPLPPPMQDNMNELLNRWRHGEVNLLQRRFRLARAPPAKPGNVSNLPSQPPPPSSNSGTATSEATSVNRDASSADDGSASSASPNAVIVDGDGRKAADGTLPEPGTMHGGGNAGAGEALPLGEVGGVLVGMDREAFVRVFPDLQALPAEVQACAFQVFECVGCGSLDFRNFCRALALCCRGSRDERSRFLFDLFTSPSRPKHQGTIGDSGPRDTHAKPGAPPTYVSEPELTALKKHLGLSELEADPSAFVRIVVGGEQRPPAGGLFLGEYFEWAEAHVSDEALDRALKPFYLLPSPQQEKEKVLTHLMRYSMREGQWMYLVAAPWWVYWCNYAGVNTQDLNRVPDRVALGLITVHVSDQGLADASASAGPNGRTDGGKGDNGAGGGVTGGNGHTQAARAEVQTGRITEDGKERAVPTMLARRPHEIDNSSLQGGAEWEIAQKVELGEDYVLLPKELWDIMVDWYGGGPIFCRQVVTVSTPGLELLDRVAAEGNVGDREGRTEGDLVVDLYPLALHVSSCDPAGRPSGRERLVLTSHHVHVKDMLKEVLKTSRVSGFLRGLSVSAGPVQEEDGSVTGDAAVELTKDQTLAALDSSEGDVRMWVFEISPSGLMDTPRDQAAASASTSCRPRFSFSGGGLLGSLDVQTGVRCWKLVKPQEEHMTLSALGLIGGEKVMVESRLPNGAWPRRRYIEEPSFRDFREQDRLDAMDYQGRWFRGQVVEVVYKNVSKVIDSDGPIGRQKSKGRIRQSQHAPEATSRGGSSREHERSDRSEAAGGGGGRATSSGVSKSSAARGGGGGGGGGTRGGGEGNTREGVGGTRKRMRVKIRFDRFAPQWDEWYDSKSLKLSPECTYTAPDVPAASLKPREEANTDSDADEASCPTVTSGNNGSRAGGNPPKGGSSAYPPLVGRLTSESYGGAQWNTRSHLHNPADGISNNLGVPLHRKSNTPGKPPLAGACGLVNLGNTCYLNSAIQCLSHTPLLRAYLLSDMWAAEVNKFNPLGTQGKLVEDFASLLKSLWSQEFLCIFPNRFRRGLIKHKSQFAGNEQQDSQEFLAEMLDALHEDVNRVRDKPYVPAPEDDAAESGRSDQELADEAWDRHVQRNRSVIVDLFQGQLKMECRCPVCNKKSVTFDPFMYLSVPIPIRNSKMVSVILLPKIRTRDIVGPRAGGHRGGDIGDAAEGEAVEFRNPRRLVPVQYGIMLPRMGEVIDLKRALSELCGIRTPSLVIAVMMQTQLRIYGDKEALINVREDDFVMAYAMGDDPAEKRAQASATPAQSSNSHVPAAQGTPAQRTPGQVAPAQATPAQATPAQATPAQATPAQATPAQATPAQATPAQATPGPVANGDVNREERLPLVKHAAHAAAMEGGAGGGQAGDAVGDAVSSMSDAEEDTDLDDDDRPAKPNADRRTPDERYMESFPRTFQELEIGWRLDALDRQGSWYPATVVEVDCHAKAPSREAKISYDTPSGASGKGEQKTERLVKIHFDRFISKWDEYYGQQEWDAGKLARLYTETRPDERILDIQVVHRKTVRIAAPTHSSFAGLMSRNDVSARDGTQGEAVARDSRDPSAGFGPTKAKDLFGLPFMVRCPPNRSARYLWRLVVHQASRFVAGASGNRGSTKARSSDRLTKAAARAIKRSHVTAAWVARAAVGLENGITDEKLAEFLPFTIKFLNRKNPLSDTGVEDLLPDRWRAASSVFCSKLLLALEWKDPSSDYLDVLANTFDHPSYLELENNAQSAHSGLTLEHCLDAYTREETLEEEDSWYCSNCRTHRRGIMKIDLWKMPDVLVMHMKRFQCSARWREKIRTLVLFPHSGLDMSGFVSANSAHRNQAGGGQAGMVYDLFGVVNHMGGMTGGHYTAYCRSSPCSKDGVEEVTGWGMEHPWLHFDDEFVEEMAPDKIVSDAAYVLFYRRRRLTPSNVINMTI